MPLPAHKPSWLVGLLVLGSASPALATPQFARTYRVDCSYCHVAPPQLNERGEDFFARGYRFADLQPIPSHRTPPLAVWSTFDLNRQAGTTRGFPSRVELIAGGPVGAGSLSYFVEWRAVSRQVGSDGRLLDRSGRFEDLFLVVPLPGRGFSVMAGQFRALSQVDVSRRLSLSEPLAFSSAVPGRPSLQGGRLTSLRAFSPAGRQPGIRLEHHREGRAGPADGWYSAVTLPLGGELTIPLTDAASFELEARPKGVFLESFYRRGLHSYGGHVFAGRGRALGNLVATRRVAGRVFFLGAAGFSRASGATDARLSVAAEYAVGPRALAGARLDHRTRQGRDPAVHLYLNGHLPFGVPHLRQALRIQVEQRVQAGAHATTVGLSHLF